MGLFSKEKDGAASGEARELPRSGCGSLDETQMLALMEDQFDGVELNFAERMFYKGFACGLAFVGIPEGEETHGIPAIEFCENGYYNAAKEEVSGAIKQAVEVAVERMGFDPERASVNVITSDEFENMFGGE